MIYTFFNLRCFPDGPVYGGRTLVLNYGLSKFIRYKDKLENLGHFKYHDIHFTSLAFSSIWLTCWMKNLKYSEIPKLTRLTRFLDDLWISPPLYIIRIWRLLIKIESAKQIQHWTPSKFNLDPALIWPVSDIAVIPWIFKNQIEVLSSPLFTSVILNYSYRIIFEFEITGLLRTYSRAWVTF